MICLHINRTLTESIYRVAEVTIGVTVIESGQPNTAFVVARIEHQSRDITF